jgi:hypothetical protein
LSAITAGLRGIVLGDSGLDLADQVGADVGGLGEDAAAQAGEDRNQRGTQRERGERGHDDAVVRCISQNVGEDGEYSGNGEQCETRDEQARDRSGAEGHGQAVLQAGPRGLGGADIGANRNVHADEARRPRQDRAGDEAGGAQAAEEGIDHDGNDDADDGDGGVLATQVGGGAFLDGAGHFDHALVAGRGAEHLLAG